MPFLCIIFDLFYLFIFFIVNLHIVDAWPVFCL